MIDEKPSNPTSVRRAVQQRAFANLVLGLLERAKGTDGRLRVRPAGQLTVGLEYIDVRTLVREGSLYRFAHRDFAILLRCPDGWPFERAAAPQPFILTPDDAAHPNSDGRAFCLDLQGVAPERLAEVLYDNLRIRQFRLDHCVDLEAASFIRTHLHEVPVDPRPLCEGDDLGGFGDEREPLGVREVNEPARLLEHGKGPLTVVDVAIGAFGVSIGNVKVPVFLRLARSTGTIVDLARSRYLSHVACQLHESKPAWMHGPGLVVESLAVEPTSLRHELLEVGHACAALADEQVARSYVEFFEEHPEQPSSQTRVPVTLDPDTRTKGGSL